MLAKLGSLLFLSLVFLPSCKTEQPPAVTTCVLDGTGAGECTPPNGAPQFLLLPTEMKGYLALSPTDAENIFSFCFDTSADVSKAQIRRLLEPENHAAQ